MATEQDVGALPAEAWGALSNVLLSSPGNGKQDRQMRVIGEGKVVGA